MVTKKKRPKILIASGVNLDLLGRREPEIYGYDTLKDMQVLLSTQWKKMIESQKFSLVFFQSNDEAKFLREFDKGYIGAVINAGAWTHTSLALADRLVGLAIPYVEVHVSDLTKREGLRQHSFLAAHALETIQGQGIRSYLLGLQALVGFLKNPSRSPRGRNS